MTEYLKRDDVLKKADIITTQTREYGTIDVVPVEYLADLPTVDVAEVKHGKWIYKRGDYITGGGNPLWCCSVCGEVVGASLAPPKYLYCHCGAKMDV